MNSQGEQSHFHQPLNEYPRPPRELLYGFVAVVSPFVFPALAAILEVKVHPIFGSLFLLGPLVGGVAVARMPLPGWGRFFLCVGYVVLAFFVAAVLTLVVGWELGMPFKTVHD